MESLSSYRSEPSLATVRVLTTRGISISRHYTKKSAKKGCNYLHKYESYPYWTHKQNRKAEKEKRKRKKAQVVAVEMNAQKRLDRIKELAQEVADRYSMDIIVTRVTSKDDGQYILNYVSDSGFIDWAELTDIIFPLTRQYSGRYTLNHIKTPAGNYATIDDYLYGVRPAV